ncbi:hypothetical protein [Vibrio atlanticus]|nr:hypothetical protein [Vibrio atlanticus]
MISSEVIKGGISSLSQSVLANGSWLFPVCLLAASFMVKWCWCRKAVSLNFYKLLMTLPIEIKLTSCTFILASLILNPNESFGFNAIFVFCIIALMVSIGFYNHLDIDGLDSCLNGKVHAYFIFSLIASILMLVVSISVMQAYEKKADTVIVKELTSKVEELSQ